MPVKIVLLIIVATAQIVLVAIVKMGIILCIVQASLFIVKQTVQMVPTKIMQLITVHLAILTASFAKIVPGVILAYQTFFYFQLRNHL